MKIFPWNDPRYYVNINREWDFLPPEHRPEGIHAFHDDWPWPFSKIPRTWTSFEFISTFTDTKIEKIDKFEWNGRSHPNPWQPQKTTVLFYDKHLMEKDYICFYFLGYLFRLGPRISNDLENGPGYVYVNFIPIPILGWFLTFGFKKL